jgi:hypothetical protein
MPKKASIIQARKKDLRENVVEAESDPSDRDNENTNAYRDTMPSPRLAPALRSEIKSIKTQ